MSADPKTQLFNNIADAMNGVPTNIIERQCKLFDQIHADYGKGVRAAVKQGKAENEKAVSKGTGGKPDKLSKSGANPPKKIANK